MKLLLSNAIVAAAYLLIVLMIDVVHVHFMRPIHAQLLPVLAAILFVAFCYANRRAFKKHRPMLQYGGIILLSLGLTVIWFSISSVVMSYFHYAIGGTGGT